MEDNKNIKGADAQEEKPRHDEKSETVKTGESGRREDKSGQKNGRKQFEKDEKQTEKDAKHHEKDDRHPDKAAEKIEKLEKELAQAREKIAADKNDYLRLMADFENLRRHSAEDRLNLINTAAEDTIKGLLPVLDDCERALEMLSKSGDEAAKEGTNLIYNKLMAYLKTKGLEVIDAKGKKFDTDFHDAVAQLPVEDKDKKGLVYDVISTGYLLNGKVLRHAKVVVGI